MSVLRKKYQLPTVAQLTHINIDLPRLQVECDKFASKFTDVISANPALCMNHAELVKNVYDNFEQINLTELNGELMEYTDNIKERIRRKEETLYNKETEDYKTSYFKEIIGQFKASAMRIRITKLAAGKTIPYHIDYDPSYATRIIIPIYTTSDVENWFIVKNEEVNHHLEAGKAYFLNTGFKHAVYNKGTEPRIALMFSLDGQDDLENISN